MGDREIAECLYERLRAECRGDETMGELETLVDRGTREARRLVLERLTRDAAVRQELGCPQCGSAMRVVNRSRPRTVESAVGAVRFARDYGRCPDCGTHAYPADEALGLHGAAHASPRLQELCALTALRAPAGRAEEDVRRLAGRDESGVDAAPRGAAAGRAGAGDQGAGRGALRDSGGKGLPRGQGAGPAGAQHADHRDRRLEHPGAGLLGGDARAPGGGGGRRALALLSTPRRSSAWTSGGRPPATGRSSPTGAMSPPARGSPTSGGSCTRRRSSAGSSRPRRPWSSETAPPGSGISPETSSPRPGSGSTSSM